MVQLMRHQVPLTPALASRRGIGKYPPLSALLRAGLLLSLWERQSS
ncbi:MAG TPA: hypothetical protein PKY15_01460 [Methanoregulaceae archaeon]|nr:hypothetical protein [Methanoregulaceae archaeon]